MPVGCKKYYTTFEYKNDTEQSRMLMISMTTSFLLPLTNQLFVFLACHSTKHSILIAQATMSSPPNNYSERTLPQKDDQFT